MRGKVGILVVAMVAAVTACGDGEVVGTTTSTVADGEGIFPYTYGDDPALDGAWDLCAAGDWAACDELGFAAPEGSDYQAFGRTCGRRTDGSQSCQAAMAGVAAPAPTETTSAPGTTATTAATATTATTTATTVAPGPTQAPAAPEQPAITAFTTTSSDLGPGECATLAWSTQHAASVTLNGTPVGNPTGQSQVCYDGLQAGLNNYTLVATNAAGQVEWGLGISKVVPAAAEAVAFISSVDEVYPGECVTLQWTTRNATEVYLNNAPVSVPAGQQDFCWGDLVLGINQFRLRAVNATSEDELTLSIVAQPPVETDIRAPFDAARSGTVAADGRLLPFVSPGDDGSDTLYEGFMTFDIRNLPGNATIVSAYLNLGTCATNGDGLGELQVYNLQYGDLGPSDFGAGGRFLASVDRCTIFSIDVTDRVEAMKAEVEFQVRLAFPNSDFDGDIDDVTYTGPTLDITYVIVP